MRLRRFAVVLLPLTIMWSGLAPTMAGAATTDGHLSGTVRNAAGAAAANSVVTLLDGSGGDVTHTTTDAAGRYSLTALQGEYTERIVTTVKGKRFAAQIANVVIGPSTNRDVIIVSPVIPPVTLTGTVRDLAGIPLAGVQVSLSSRADTAAGNSTATAMTGPDGTYRLSVAPDTYSVDAQFGSNGDFYAVGGDQYVLKRDTSLDLTFDHPRQPVVVRDEHGSPVSGAWVSVHSPYSGCTCRAGFDLFPGAVNTLVTWGAADHTDSTGTVELPLFAADAVIGVQPPTGRADLAPMPDTHYPPPHASPLVVVEPSPTTVSAPGPSVTFRGHLHDSAGVVPDVNITLGDDHGQTESVRPDTDGSFTLTAAPGHYQLGISGFETNHSRTGDSGGPDPDLWLSIPDLNLTADRIQDITIPTRSLAIQVLDRDGNRTSQPMVADSTANSDHPVELFPGGLASGRLEDSGGSAADGTTTLQVLAGSVVDLAAGWEYPLGTATVNGDAATATVHLTAVTLKGTLHDARGVMGEPTWRSAWVSLDTTPCNPPISTQLDAQKGYSVARMPGGYTLCVSDTVPWDWGDVDQVATDTLPLQWSISNPYHVAGDRTLDLTVPDAAPVHITAVDEAGQPLNGWLALTATTTASDVPVAPGITGSGSVDNGELQSDHGDFHPLLFGASTADVWIARSDESLGHHFLANLAPGDDITAAVAAPDGVPSAPRNVRAVTSGDNRTITWDPPADPGGSPITGYLVTYDLPGSAGVTITVPPSLTSATIPADPRYSSERDGYNAWVAAVNDAGAGPTAGSVIGPTTTSESTIPTEPPISTGSTDPTGSGQSTTGPTQPPATGRSAPTATSTTSATLPPSATPRREPSTSSPPRPARATGSSTTTASFKPSATP